MGPVSWEGAQQLWGPSGLPGQRLPYGHVCGVGDGGGGGKMCAKWQGTNYGYCVGGGFRLGVCLCVCERVLMHPHSHAHNGAKEQLGDRVSRNEQSHPRGNTTPGVMMAGSSWEPDWGRGQLCPMALAAPWAALPTC